MAAVDLRASRTGYLTLDQAAAITVCPCSNHRLQVNRRFFGGENPTRQLLTKGLKVTLNSDDPAYFFGHTDKYGTTHGGPPCRNQNISLRAFDAPGRWRGGVV